MCENPDQYEYITGTTKAGNVWIPQFIESLNQENCIGCGRCCKVCTRQVFEMVEHPTEDDVDVEKVTRIAHPGECIGDAACQEACPRKNITCQPQKKKEAEDVCCCVIGLAAPGPA